MIVTIKTLQQKTFKIELDDTENVRFIREPVAIFNAALGPHELFEENQYVSSLISRVSMLVSPYFSMCIKGSCLITHTRKRRALIRNVPSSLCYYTLCYLSLCYYTHLSLETFLMIDLIVYIYFHADYFKLPLPLYYPLILVSPNCLFCSVACLKNYFHVDISELVMKL